MPDHFHPVFGWISASDERELWYGERPAAIRYLTQNRFSQSKAIGDDMNLFSWLKQALHFKKHELNIGKHNNDTTVNAINALIPVAIDQAGPAVLGLLANKALVHPNALKGLPIPASELPVVAEAINAAIHDKLTGTSATP